MAWIRAGRVPRWRGASALVAGLVVVAAVPASAAGAWRIEAGSVNANARLNAVSCVSATVCAAVGEIGNDSRTFKTYAESPSGSTWSVAPSTGPAGSDLLGVSCVAADWCQAVGDYSDMGGLLTEHWDGHTWSQIASPVPSGSLRELHGVSCTSRAWCVAVGTRLRPDDVGATVIEHWNGTKWSIVPSPNRGKTASTLMGVSCVSTKWCIATGYSQGGSFPSSQTLIEAWNGKAWHIVPSANPPSTKQTIWLLGVECRSTTWCVAVGYAWSGSIIEQWNGHAWKLAEQPTANTAYTRLNSVSCASRVACTAVGSNDNGPIVQTWNGTAWSGAASAASSVSSVSCVTATLCKTVGDGTAVYTNG